MLAYEYSFKREEFSPPSSNTLYRLIKKYFAYLVLAVIYIIIRTYAIGGFSPIKTHAYLSNYEYFINVFPLFMQYLGKLILPINLSAAYVFHPIHSLLEWEGITAFVLTLCFIVTLYLVRNHNRVVFFSLLWVAIPLLPAFYIPALGESPFAERYLYLPSVGFVIIVSLGLCGIANLDALRNRATPFMLSIVFVITVLYSAGTIKRNPVWRDNFTLWSDAVKKSPDSYLSQYNLGLAYGGLRKTDEAIVEHKKAIRLKPYSAKAHNNLGLAYYDMGRMDEAVDEYKKAISLRPGYAGAHNNLGLAYYDLGRMDEAVDEYKKAISLRPGYAGAHNNLGIAYYDLGRMDEAIGEYKKAISLRPSYADAHNNLGLVYYDMGRMDEAVVEYKKAISLRPDYAGAHNNLGLAYYDIGRLDEAVEEYKKAIKVKPGFAKAHNNLGTAYITQGRIDEGINEYREALRLAPDLTDTRFNLALAYKRKGFKKEAVRELEKYLRFNPRDTEARKILDEMLAED
jgi:tetratricopeptide (TPR) repeat protein